MSDFLKEMDIEEKKKWISLDIKRKSLAMRYVKLTMKNNPTHEDILIAREILKESMQWDDFDLADIPDFIIKKIMAEDHDWVGF